MPAPTPSLFEFLGIASQERIHSQTLAWLLTPHVSPLRPAHRRALLAALGVKCTLRDVQELRVQTELEGLDLVCASPKVFVVIENKLKSRQSSLQLLRYDEKIGKVAGLLDTTGAAHKIFLTLSHEKSGCGWTDVDYRALVGPLAAAAQAEKNLYVADYVALVTRLVGAREAFLTSPGNFEQVHRRIGWSTVSRLKRLPAGTSTDEAFICENRLERIFVETLLRNLVSDVPNAITDAGAHGQPLVQVPLWLVEVMSGEWYRAGLQLQGKTLKLNIADLDYEGSSNTSKRLDVFNGLFEGDGLARKAVLGSSRDYRSWVWPAPPPLRSISPPAADYSRAFLDEFVAASTTWERALTMLLGSGRINSFKPWTPALASRLLDVRRASRRKSA